MKSLKDALRALNEELGGTDEAGRIARRRAEVQELFRNAVEAVYKQNAYEAVLRYVNEVYVVDGAQVDVRRFDRPRYGKRQGGRILVVYCSDAMARSDLDNYQEFLRLKFAEQGEHIDAVDLVPSIGEKRNRHPFSPKIREGGSASGGRLPDLSPEEITEAEAAIENIEDAAAKKALLRAMIARKRLEKSERQQS